VRALRNYARLSRARFDKLNSVSSQADRLTQIVNVYKAMGGGWVEAADAMVAASQK
jgi:multidrug efflux system outer membrane protein